MALHADKRPRSADASSSCRLLAASAHLASIGSIMSSPLRQPEYHHYEQALRPCSGYVDVDVDVVTRVHVVVGGVDDRRRRVLAVELGGIDGQLSRGHVRVRP